jgi:GTP cyclohydrolase FolE2
MRIQQSLIVYATALVVSMSTSYAGPCSQEIARFRAEIDAKQHSNAAAGSSALESTAATTHRQPTQWSIGAAESQLGEVSPEKLQAVMAAVDRASEADRAGDQVACEEALADAWRAFSQ